MKHVHRHLASYHKTMTKACALRMQGRTLRCSTLGPTALIRRIREIEPLFRSGTHFLLFNRTLRTEIEILQTFLLGDIRAVEDAAADRAKEATTAFDKETTDNEDE